MKGKRKNKIVKLKELLALILDENKHEIQFNDPLQGKEVW